jgi:cytochrome P450
MSPLNIIYLSLLESAVGFYIFPNALPVSHLTGALLFFGSINLGAYVIYRVFIYPFFLDPLRHLPKPKKGFVPILGHGLSMFKRPVGSTQLQTIKDTPNDGIILTRGFFHESRLLLTSPAALADVLVHKSYDFEKPPWVRTFLRQFLGDGMLMTEGDEHRHQRKQIMPAFHFRHIKELYPVFWNKSFELCQIVQGELRETPGKIIDLTHFSTQVTLDIIGLAGLGRDIGSLRNSDDALVENYEEILEPTTEKLVYFVLHLVFPAWLIKALPWKLNERVKVTTTNLNQICMDFVREKRLRMKTESDESLDILAIMIRSQNFSDQGLVDQLLTFLAAGCVRHTFGWGQ